MKTELKKGISKKTGEEYYYLSIMITPTYEKKVFLDSAEIELIRIMSK